ncbi:uncharacterized protein [Miscanthus floridulus]|uniref:uncharacterized protein n=1 Tax=Miscanthus floridulus TaxID=154761 RepID=UPI003458196F
MAVRPSVQEAEMKAAEASVAPLVQGPPLLRESARETKVYPISDDPSRAREVVDAEDAGAVEAAAAQTQLAPLAARVKELEEELPRAVSDWDAFRGRAVEATASAAALARQLGAEQRAHRLTKGALDEALAAAEASRTEAVVWRGTVEELGSEASRAAEASRVEAQLLKEEAEASRAEALRWKEKAEACQVETRRWEQKAKESETEVTRAAEASSAMQTVLETEIGEHEALKRVALSACEALEVEGVQSGSSLGSRLIALSNQMRERLRGALHTGVKRALAVISSHYVGVDLPAISDGYVPPDDDEEADAAVTKLMEVAEGPGTASYPKSFFPVSG